MGNNLIDEYSVLHFATGIISYYWGITAAWFFIIHTVFELSENTQLGMKIINSFPFWPGGKNHADSLLNILGDTLFAMLGWFLVHSIFMITGSPKPIEMRAI